MSYEDKQQVCSDCWITARDAERERIIELLKDDCECIFEINQYYFGCHNHQLIALIKGENK